jgi:hypothetical protein
MRKLRVKKSCCCVPSPQRCCCKQGGTGPSGGGGTTSPPWTPQPQGSYLLIQYDAADTGVRPIPSGDVWWLSPDVWVTGGDGLGNPVAGRPCMVNARVWNLGTMSAIPTSVEFFYIEPGLAIPLTIPQPINAVPAYALVPGGEYVDVGVPWTPPPTVGNVHTCLIVTCSCVTTGDVPTVPGNAIADRHTGQRNVTLVGTPIDPVFKFELAMRNLLPNAASVGLGARAMWLTPPRVLMHFEQFDPLALTGAIRMIDRPNTTPQQYLLGRRAAMLLDHGKAMKSTAVAQADVAAIVQVTSVRRDRTLHTGEVIPPRARVDGTTDAITRIGNPIDLKSLQQATVHCEITVPVTPDNHEYFVVHIFQLTRDTVDGGYTIAFKVGSADAAAHRASRLPRRDDEDRDHPQLRSSNQPSGDNTMSVKPIESSDHELLAAIVEEVDEARDVHELAKQLEHALPLRSFDDLVKAVGAKGTITFRGSPHTVANFVDIIPDILFPIDGVTKLVTLLAATVRLAPAHLRYSGNDESHAKVRLRRLGILGVQGSIGVLGKPRATARAPTTMQSPATEPQIRQQ